MARKRSFLGALLGGLFKGFGKSAKKGWKAANRKRPRSVRQAKGFDKGIRL
jgi:hypothetical protein